MKSKKLEPIKSKHIGCLNCNGTVQKLSMRTKIYNGFGGWTITKNGELVFMEEVNTDLKKSKSLSFIEKQARYEPDEDWRAELFLPLRGATYQRHGKNKWILVAENIGFA